MITKKSGLLSKSLAFLALLLACIYLLWSIDPYLKYWFQQRQLANALGVSPGDFPAAYAFPVGYFHEILQPGMTMTQAHEIIRGYLKVYRCDGWYGEV
jgi:hypothetical protein